MAAALVTLSVDVPDGLQAAATKTILMPAPVVVCGSRHELRALHRSADGAADSQADGWKNARWKL